MTLPYVIINPESAAGRTRNQWPSIASDLNSHFGPFRPVFTERAGQARDLAAEAARKGIGLIVACGGDGTISEVANGILLSGKDSELGVLPSGTGGDFRRTLGIPNRPRDAAKILRDGRTRRIDVGRVSFIDDFGGQATRYFVGVASFGMSAEVIQRVKDEPSEWLPVAAPGWMRGRAAFASAMLRTAMKAPTTRIVVQLDDHHEKYLTVTNLCVANARYFGGGMKIAPDAKLDDGRFDVVSVGDLGARKILQNSPRVYFGSHLSLPEVGHALAQKIVVRPVDTGTEVPLEVDGELPGRLPATFHVLPGLLRVRCPR